MGSKKGAILVLKKHKSNLPALYKKMFLIRKFEEKLNDLFSKDLLFGTIHACIGQEANAVGITEALDKNTDIVVSNHRGHGHYIAFTDDVEGLMAEIMGRDSGVVGGRGGSQHLHNRNFYSNGIQGGMVPIAAGIAFAEKMKGKKTVVVCFIGDGTLGQGNVYESMNMASLFNLPVFFVLENNLYAMSTHVKDAVAGNIVDRPKAFAIKSEHIASNDAEVIYQKATSIIEQVRKTSKPFFLCIDTYRLCGHSRSDTCTYRKKDEEIGWRKKDPLLIAMSKLDIREVGIVEKECVSRIEKCFQMAQKSSFPKLRK